MSNNQNPHYHANMIHAWADGAKIQYFSKKRDKWVTVTNPSWDVNKEYRLKLVLEDWQQELVDAVKDGATVEYNFMGNWLSSSLNDLADNKDDVREYVWASQDKYRIKPTEVTPRIELDGYLLIGTRFDEKGEPAPYLRTVPLGYSVRAGDSGNINVSFDE